MSSSHPFFGGSQKGGPGGFQKGGFGGFSPAPKTGTRVNSHVPRYQKPERGHIRQNHPFTKPSFCQKNLCVRKKYCPQFWGWKWLCQFHGRLENLRSFCRKTSMRPMPVTFLVLGGVFRVLFSGGGEVPILFLWARGFSDFVFFSTFVCPTC